MDSPRLDRDSLLRELERDGIRDPAVLAALAAVPRERFVPERDRRLAWGNFPVDIGAGQTISQPFIVAYMTQAARLVRTSRVLEVGAGSGYQTAILAHVLGLGPEARAGEPHGELHAIEILPELAARANVTLASLGFSGVSVQVGDGSRGDPAHGPYDAILVAAAPPRVPETLVQQLAEGGRLVIPVGDDRTGQDLLVLRRDGPATALESSLPVRFVPMTGAGT